MWASIPPLKLCAHCLVQCAQYNHVALEEYREACNFEQADIEALPIIDGIPAGMLEELNLS